MSATWPSSTARRSQILRDGFDSRLEPIAFDIYTGWLLTRRAQAHFAISLNYCSIFSSIKFENTLNYLFMPYRHILLLNFTDAEETSVNFYSKHQSIEIQLRVVGGSSRPSKLNVSRGIKRAIKVECEI